MWGGGIYQPSDELTGGYDFYAACDELGIFAWSELIFSDALYPINDWLLASVAPEVRQNVRRINRHPSNAQWAGGNEIEGIVITVNQTLANGTHYLDEVRGIVQIVSSWLGADGVWCSSKRCLASSCMTSLRVRSRRYVACQLIC